MREAEYDRTRLAQFLAGEARADGLTRRGLMWLSAGVAAGTAIGGAPARAADPPILKPLPPDLFTVFGTNAETRWEALRDTGYLVPVDRFFVRNHTLTPRIDAESWRLRVSGSGLRGGPVELTYRQLRDLPSDTITAAIECAGNGRSFFASQQGQAVSGTAWKLGAIGVARWKGVRLSTVLKRAGLLVGRQTVKSAFELPWEGTLAAGRQVLRGRSWSGNGRIRRVEVSTDGRTWRPARPIGHGLGTAWQRWEYPWHPARGAYTLRARATDVAGVTQPEAVPHNTLGYLFGAIVRHPVTVL